MAEQLGSVFVELDLDSSRYLKSQQQLLKDATTTSLSIEQNFRNLGIKTSAEYDLMRQKISNSYQAIMNDHKATANDILRAEEAKNAKLKQLNEQQYGAHKTVMQQITDSTTAHFSAAIIGSQMVMRAVDMVGSAITGAFSKGFNAVEEYNLSVASMAAMVVTFTDRAKGMTFAEHWKEALEYSQNIIPVLENIAAKTLLSGQETTALANAFARSGVFLDANNQKQIESFTRISNALPVMTKGQEIMKQINSEIRAVMTGSQEATSMMLQTLKAIDPEIEKNLKTWRAQGTVLENIGGLLVGFGPATELLENQWQAVNSTLDTTVTQVLRGSMQGAYTEIISSTQEINKWLEEHKDTIQTGISVGWSLVSNTVSAVWNVLAGFGPMLKDVGELVGVIAYGWGGVFAVLKPIGAFLGNSIALTYEIGKAIGNLIVMSGALATGQLTLAKTTYDESKKGWDEIVRLSEQNRTILTDGIGDAITGYEQQAAASKTTQDKIKGHITGTAKVQKEVDKERATALKHANEQIEKDLNKLTLTVEEQIQEQADKWEKLGVNKTKIQEWTSAKMAEINQKEAEKVLKIQQAANEQIAQHRRKATDDYEKLMSEEADFAMNENERAMAKITAQEQDKLWKINVMLQEETITWEQYELARTQITTNAAQNRLEKELNEAKRRADINYNAIQNIKGMEEEAFQMRLAQIDAEAAKRIKDGGDAVLIAKWVADEQQKAYIQMGKAGDDWSAGAQAALLELTRQHTTWGSTAYEVTKTFTDDARAQLSDNFFNLFKGNIDELGFDWDTMWDKMLQTLSKKISDMVVEAAAHDILLLFKSQWVEGGSQVLGIVSQVLGFAGNLFGGGAGGSTGFGDWTDGLGFASGGRVPGLPSSVDNTLAMVASGEHIIPAALVAAAEQGRGGDTMLAHINPAEAAILRMLGGAGTTNPRTGLPEFYTDFNTWLARHISTDPESYGAYPAGMNQGDMYDWWQREMAAETSPYPTIAQALSDPNVYGLPTGGSQSDIEYAYKLAQMKHDYPFWLQGLVGTEAGKALAARQYNIYNQPNWSTSGVLASLSEAIGAGYINVPILLNPNTVPGYAYNPDYFQEYEMRWTSPAAWEVQRRAELNRGPTPSWQSAMGNIMPLAAIAGIAATVLSGGAAAGAAASAVEEASYLSVAEALGQIPSVWSGSALQGLIGSAALEEASYLSTAEALGEIPSVWGNIAKSDWSSILLDKAKSFAIRQGIRLLVNQLLGAGISGDAGGYMQVSYEGAQDGGLLSSLAGIMSSMQGRGNFNVNPFSARDGLDYVPYDNFPIRAHKGEAVLTAKENRERLSGGGGDANVTIHIENFYGDSDGINMLAQKVGDILDTYKRRGWRA